jgi:hypothetical protein
VPSPIAYGEVSLCSGVSGDQDLDLGLVPPSKPKRRRCNSLAPTLGRRNIEASRVGRWFWDVSSWIIAWDRFHSGHILLSEKQCILLTCVDFGGPQIRMGTGCSAGLSPAEICTMIFKWTGQTCHHYKLLPPIMAWGKQAELEGFLGVFDRSFSQYG